MVCSSQVDGESTQAKLPLTESVSDLRLLGISHQTADLEFRSALSLNPGQKKDLLQTLLDGGASEAFAVSTCNRTEIYFHGSSTELVISELSDFCNVDLDVLQSRCYRLEGWEVVRHLFSVASGLKSAALGESEILGQLKTAFQIAREVGSIGKKLEPLMQRTLRASKRIRTHSGLGKRGLSLGSATVSRAISLTHGREHRSILVLGAGQIAESVVKNLRHRDFERVVVCNRTLDRATVLAAANNYRAVPFQELEDSVRAATIIIAAATVQSPLINEAILKRTVQPGTLLIDLGVPPNICASARNREDLHLIQLDEILQQVERSSMEVAKSMPQAEALVREELEVYAAECLEREAAPCIEALVAQSEEVRRRNLEWALAQIPEESAKERKLLEDLSIRLTRGMLSKPIKNLKTDFREPHERATLTRFFEAEA